MPGITILRESPVVRTARVAQLEGLFDMPPSERAAESWDVELTLPDEWNVGLIVGPSGSGKSTVARELFGQALVGQWEWDSQHSIVDSFPREMGIKEIVELLNSVGFSSPPSWLKPYHVLSNGEKFRVDMARTLAEQPALAVVDEFTSVVDRTVAQIGSAAIAKTVRRRNQKFIAVACHYDIIEWLEPDWIYQPHSGELVVGRSRRRPDIEIELQRVDSSAWLLFKKHHYLDTSLNKAAACFLATWNGVPVAFASVLHFPHARVKNMKREHRTVCLPDYQGVGIGNAVSDLVGSMVTTLGYRYQSQTAHPSMISSRNRSLNWKMVKEPTYEKAKPGKNSKIMSWHDNARIRFVATFEYMGPKMPFETALKLWRGG
jgi:ABC-type dipeptide/oligopeptide/nickel transport system ATPase subunit